MTTFRAQRTDGQGWIEGYYYKLSTRDEGVITYDSKESGDLEHELVDPTTLQIKTTKGEFKPINEVEIL